MNLIYIIGVVILLVSAILAFFKRKELNKLSRFGKLVIILVIAGMLLFTYSNSISNANETGEANAIYAQFISISLIAIGGVLALVDIIIYITQKYIRVK